MGMFDDLIPQQPAAPAAGGGGMFDDLIPKAAAAPAEPNGDISATRSVTQGATGLNEGMAHSVLRPIEAAGTLLNRGIDFVTGAPPTPASHPLEDAFNSQFVTPAGDPQNRFEGVLRAGGRMTGENLPLMATGAGAAGAGLRSGVTMAEQAAPVVGNGVRAGVSAVANKVRGAADAVLEGMAANPVASAVGENVGAAVSGTGGQVGRNVAKDAGGSEHQQEAAELAGQLLLPSGAAAYSKVAPTRLAAKAGKFVADKVLDTVPEAALPDQLRPASGTYADRKAEKLAYSNREGQYADPDVPAPPEGNFATRRMDAAQGKREANASEAASKEFKQIVDQPDAAANLAEAQRLETAVPGFKPGVAKATQDPALLKLQDTMEGRSTGDELRGVQQAHDSTTKAIRAYKDNIVPPVREAPLERIRSAAIRHDNRVYEAPIHTDAYEAAAKGTGKSFDDIVGATHAEDSGFVTSSGRYVSREEAAKIAQSAKQTGKLEDADLEAEHLSPDYYKTGGRAENTGTVIANPQDRVAAANAARVQGVNKKVDAGIQDVNSKITGVSDSLPEVDPTATGNILRDTRKSLKGEADARMKELRAGVDPEGGAVVTLKGDKPENDVTMSVNQALDRRAQINQDLADHYNASNRDAAANRDIRRLQAEKETLDGAIEDSSAGGAKGLKEYNDYYRNEYAPRFLQGASRDVGRFNRNGYEGNKVSAEDVPTKMLGPNSISEARQVNKLYGEDPVVKQQIIDHHLDDLRRTAVDPNTGQLREGAVNKYLAKNERLFNEMPWVREAISAKNPDELYARLGQLEQRQRAVADTKVAKLFNQGKNPEQHIDAALNDWQVMKGLRNSVRGDPQAEAALRRAVIDRAPDPMDVQKFKAWLDGNDRSLRQVLDPTHIKSLQDVLAAAKINGQLPRPTGTVDLPGSLADKSAKRFGITVPSLLQRALSVKQGRMSAEYGVADVATRVFRQFSNKEIENAWKEALYNPKVAKDLQLMVKGDGATKIQLARMRNYLLSVGLHDAEERAQH